MQLSKSQRGSAVVEFVLLGAPAVLLFVGLVTLAFNNYLDTIGRMITLEASRYAALADVSLSEADRVFANRAQQLLRNSGATTSIELLGDGRVLATMIYRPMVSFFAITAQPVQIKVVTPLEVR